MTDLLPLPPTQSPWGSVDHAQRVTNENTFFVSTPGHGGLMIPEPVALCHLSPDVVAKGERFRGNILMWLCFEEDCDYVLPLLEWRELRLAMLGDEFPTDEQFVAFLERMAKRWNPAVRYTRDLRSLSAEEVPA